MNTKVNHNKLYNLGLFCVIFSLLLLRSAISGINQGIHITLNTIQIFGILCLIISFGIKVNKFKIYIKDIIKISILVVSSMLSYVFSSNKEWFYLILILIFSYKTDFNESIKIVWKAQLTAIILIIISSTFGGIGNQCIVSVRNNEIIHRYNMGFSHPNSFSALMLQLFILYVYINHEKIGNLKLIFILLCSTIVYKITYSRTSLILCYAFIILVLIIKNITILKEVIFKNKTILKYGALLIILISGVLLIYGIVNYTELEKIDYNLYSRVRLINDAFENYNITLFGQHINLISSNMYYHISGSKAVLDNAYIYMILMYGMTNFLILLYYYLKTVNYLSKKQKTMLLICVLIYMFFGFFEKYSIDFLFNFTLLIFSNVIYKNNDNEGLE